MSTSCSDTVGFSSDIDGYTVYLGFSTAFADSGGGWLKDSDFTVTTDSITGEKKVTYNRTELAKNYDAKLQDLADQVWDSLQKTSISATTGAGETRVSGSVTSSTTTNNKRFSSQTITGDREVKIQAGCLEGQYIAIKLPSMNTGILKIGGVDVGSFDSASTSIERIDQAVAYISSMRAGYGATQNRLEAAMRLDDITYENSQAAESSLRDVDMAKESVQYAIRSVLVQAGYSVETQAMQRAGGMVDILL